ncbi:MAG: TonB-dependent receptor [Acidobacteriota bacterium]
MQLRVTDRVALAGLLGILIAASSANAQIGQAEIRGTVVDESGGALPGVTVTATHVDTGTIRTTVTSTTGVFLMPALQVGRYRLQLELAGFNTFVQENLPLEVGQSLVLSFAMRVATLQETVTVTGESPLVETQKSELAGRVSAAQVENLPLNGRNWLDLVALVPGARGNPGTIRAGFAGGDMAKYQVDGVDVSNQCCGGSNQGYSQENIQEFEVITNRYDAEYGRAAGVVINAVTKSGTNQIRGTGFTFVRDSDLGDARNFITKQVSPFREKQSGLNGGGPIRRDRAFFFVSYEYQTRDVTAIPRTGFTAFDVPANNGITRHYTTVRVDAQAGQSHRVFARASQYNWEQLNVGVGGRNALSNGYSRPSDNTDVAIGDTWVVSSRLVHEIRAGFSAIDNRLISNSTMPLHTFPSIVIGSPTNSPQWWKEFNVQINNSISYFIPAWRGEHNLRAGFQFFRPRFWGAFPSSAPHGAQFTFATDPRDPNDPSTYPAPTRYAVVLGDPSYIINNPTYAAFVKDDWALSSKLTLNLGVRYDVETGTVNKDLQNPIEPGKKKGDYNNFAPRLGFAYDLLGNGRTVVRGGYGRNFDKVLLNITSNERRQLLFQFATQTVLNPSYTDPLRGITFEDIKRQNLPRNMTVIANDYRTPTQDQLSVGLAQQLGQRYAVQLDFIRAEGFNEPRSRSINFFEDPVTHLPIHPRNGRPFPQFNDITRYETTASSLYNGWQFGFQAREIGPEWLKTQSSGSYTLSWTRSDHESNRFDGVTNPFNLADEWAFSASDQRHRFITNTVSRLPWGFQLSSIFFAGSKRPINTRTNLDPFGTGTGRWLDATGRTIGRNSARTPTNDYKLDVRIAKTVAVGRVRLQGIVEAFNVLNIENLTTYNGVFGSNTYLQPASSTDIFYQPRQLQFGFRVNY